MSEKDDILCLRERNAELLREVERLRSQLGSVAAANARAALEMASLHEARQKELVEQSKRLRAALDEAESAARKKDEFLAKVSHELRTPLNGIIGMVTLLIELVQGELQHEYASTALESAEALLVIINDLLDLSKIQAARLELVDEDVDLWRMVDAVTRLLGPKVKSDEVELAGIVHPDTPFVVRGDEARLRQVLINLCGNAIKFTEKGSVVLEVRPSVDRRQLILEVRDTGCGIPQESLEDVFESFRQLDNSTSRRHGGTGLGLAISRSLAEMMGGTVEVESELGQGSTFRASIPLRLAANSEAPEGPRLTGRRVHAFVAEGWVARVCALHAEALGASFVHHDSLAPARTGRVAFSAKDVVLIDTRGFAKDDVLVVAGGARRAHAEVALLMPIAGGTGWTDTGGFEVLWTPLANRELVSFLLAPRGASAKHGQKEPDGAEVPVSPLEVLDVLVVEDNPVNQRVARRSLERLGHRPTLASSGAEALDWLENARFDIVLMDCQMPGMDGYETTRRIRATEGHVRSALPIVALTANAMSSDRDRCLAAGMDDYLSKPIDLGELNEVLRRWSKASLEPVSQGDSSD